jgi:pimeloyl-ACP methyl ester carboxylesterase
MKPLCRRDFAADSLSELSGKFFQRAGNSKRITGIFFEEDWGYSTLKGNCWQVGGDHSIPAMGESLRRYFQDVTSVVVRDSGHFVPEEQPEALAKALFTFL